MVNPFKNKSVDAPEEHHITLASGILEVAFNVETKTVFMIDQTGSVDEAALIALEQWYTSKGWFLHVVAMLPSTVREERQ
jgi:hypothetical protein